MPNWCANKVWLSGLDTTVVDLIPNKVEGGETDGGLFSYFHPMPEDIYKGDLGSEEMKRYGSKNWYDWSCLQLGN